MHRAFATPHPAGARCCEGHKVAISPATPFCIPSEQTGGRQRFEIHHLDYIREGGEVYDMFPAADQRGMVNCGARMG
ncbi:hypothetical protein [Citrobacter tructae]|uniref:hypothetical protein n=1 Tax=Citrobacter tructae TaxID=2562449 RepID=UPI003F55EBE6